MFMFHFEVKYFMNILKLIKLIYFVKNFFILLKIYDNLSENSGPNEPEHAALESPLHVRIAVDVIAV